MSTDAPHVSAEDLVIDGRVRLEDLVDRDGLDELCKSFVALFGIPVRIYSTDGALLADADGRAGALRVRERHARRAQGLRRRRWAPFARAGPGRIGRRVWSRASPGRRTAILALEYDGRRVGRLIVGPFLPANVADVPASLLGVDRGISKERAQTLLGRMPRAKPETITRIAAHLKARSDLILFSGHKALVTSKMHLASVRESYRQLEDKTARLQEAFDRLKELDRLKSNFLATVSHELRTPLTSIIGYSEMLSEGLAGELKPEQAEFVKTIHDKGEQLLSLIMGLLDLSKLESGTMRTKMRSIRIEPVLGEVVSTLTPTARKKGVKLELDVGRWPRPRCAAIPSACGRCS